jgi:uncharacterized protein
LTFESPTEKSPDSAPKSRGWRRNHRDNFSIRRFAGTLDHAEGLDHLRVAHVTDLHVGRVTPMAAQLAAVELTNEESPDLVVITGDFVCHSQAYLQDLEEVVSGYDAPVMCVLGNHDYWSGAQEVIKSLRRAGAEVLRNQNTTVELRGQQLQLVGVDDAYTGHHSIADAVKGLDPNLPTLGLSHIAEEADHLWEHGVPLVLSGHTHGGQVTLAGLHELALGRLVGHKYVHGLYGSRSGIDAGAVYVGAGVGAAVLPVRLGERAKREITIFELGHAPGSFEEHHAEQLALPGRAPSEKKAYKRAAKVVKRELKRRKRAQKVGD